jgi:hypothetical protein
MKNFVGLSVVLLLAGCGMSEEEQRLAAQSACAVISSLPGDAASERIREVNVARQKLDKVVFTGRDENIRNAVKYGVCADFILDRDDYDQLLSKQIEIDKEQQQKRVNTAIYTCNVMGESRNMDAAFRIKELNAARTEIGGSMYLGTDDQIRESFEYGLCSSLVLEDSYEEKLRERKEAERVAAAKRAEEERIAGEKRREAERIAAAKKAEADQIAAAKKAEADQIAAAKKAEADRIAAAELEEVIAEYKKAVEAELSKYRFSFAHRGYSGLSIYPDDGSIYLTVKYRTSEGMIALFDETMHLELDSIAIDFNDPELPDFVNIKNSIGGSNLDFMMSGGYDRNDRGSGEHQISFDGENRLTRDQRALFVSKFGTGFNGRVFPPKSAFKVVLKVKGVNTYSPEPFEFECKNFKLLKSKDLCSRSSFRKGAEFAEPIVITI